MGILNCGFRMVELNRFWFKGLLREILCVARKLENPFANLLKEI